jgi:exodeoxyribonuclease V gamma subunit
VIRAALADQARTPAEAVARAAARLRRAGALPIAVLGSLHAQQLLELCTDVASRYRAQLDASAACRRAPVPIDVDGTRIELDDALLRETGDGSLLRLLWSPNAMVARDGRIRHDRLLDPWVGHLLTHAAGRPVCTRVIAPGFDVMLRPLHADTNLPGMLKPVLDAYRDGMRQPLPLARRTGFAWLQRLESGQQQARNAAATAYDGGEFGPIAGESNDPYLARAYPDFDALDAAGFADRVGLLAPVLAAAEVCQ